MSLDEFGRIARFLAPLAANWPGAFGLEDDAASVSAPPGCDLVVTSDAIVAGVHYLPDDPPEGLGRKLLGVNLSDLAAKGAVPLAYSLVLALPDDHDDAWLAAFCRGLQATQMRAGCSLIGGDSVRTGGSAVLAATLFGSVPTGRMLRRAGGRPGDRLWVTGTLGDAALGLDLLQGRLPDSGGDAAHHLIDRYRHPAPPVALGPALRPLATAALDISDGLVADLGHLARASGCAARVALETLPLSTAAAAVVAADPGRWPRILAGGDDYETLLAAPAEVGADLRAAAAAAGTRLTEIGALETGPPGRVWVLDRAGQDRAPAVGGWRHR